MKNQNVIFKSEDNRFRILEIADECCTIRDLAGDTYDPKHNPDIAPETLALEYKQFQDLVEREGVFGYVLEKWNPSPDCGWEHVDSCWGFVGRYSPGDKSGTFDHYIVNELKSLIK